MKKHSSPNPSKKSTRSLSSANLRAVAGGGMMSVMERMAYPPDGCRVDLTDDVIGLTCPAD